MVTPCSKKVYDGIIYIGQDFSCHIMAEFV